MKKRLATTFACTVVLFGGCTTGPYSTYQGTTNRGGGGYRYNAYPSSGGNYQPTQITNVQQNTVVQNPQYNNRINILNQRMRQQQMDLKAQAKQQHLQEMEALKQRNATQAEIAALKKHWHTHEREQEARLRQAHEQEIQQLRQEFTVPAQEQQQIQPGQNAALQPTTGANTDTASPVSTDTLPVPVTIPAAPPVTAPTPITTPAAGFMTGPVGRDSLFGDQSTATPTAPQQKHKKYRNNDDTAPTAQTQPEAAQSDEQAAPKKLHKKRWKRPGSGDAASEPGE